MIFVRIYFQDRNINYKIVINNEEYNSHDQAYSHAKSTAVEWTGYFDARMKHAKRRHVIMLFSPEQYQTFLDTNGRLPAGILIAKQHATYHSTHELVSLAAKCDLSRLGEKFGVILPVNLRQEDRASTSLQSKLELNVEIQLFKEGQETIDTQLEWITNFKQKTTPFHARVTAKVSDGSIGPCASSSGMPLGGGNRSVDSTSTMMSDLDMTTDDLAPKLKRGAHRQAMKRPKQIEHMSHHFQLTYFREPTFCGVCKDFIWGVVSSQAYRCGDCYMSTHEKCVQRVLTTCQQAVSSGSSGSQKEASTDAKSERFGINIPHSWANHTFLKPTFCSHCGQMLYGFLRQGLKCKECSNVCHNRCRLLLPPNCGIDALHMVKVLEQINMAKQKQSMREASTSQVAPDNAVYHTFDEMTASIYHTLAHTHIPANMQAHMAKHHESEYQSLSIMKKEVESGEEPNYYAAHATRGADMKPVAPPRQTGMSIRSSPAPPPRDPTGRIESERTARQQNSLTNIGSRQRNAPRIDINSFTLHKVLGQGSFGKVFLAQFKNQRAKPRRLVALKALRKDATIDNNDVMATLIERNILKMGGCPFLANLVCSFQDEDRLYFVMEFLAGGDLMYHVQRNGRFRTHEARFYACEIACGLEFLHSQKIVYRDLKLDNVLLDKEGHAVLADFGMCKERVTDQNKCATFCGTPDYLAPEIVKGKLYTFSVDWWSFGVLLYEMIIGQSPFYGRTEEDLYKNILEKDLKYPAKLAPDAKACLKALFNRDPSRRLGVTGSVLNDDFFKDHLNIGNVRKRQEKPIFVPKINPDGADASYFDAEFTKAEVKISRCEKHIMKNEQAFFTEFSYTNESLLAYYKQ